MRTTRPVGPHGPRSIPMWSYMGMVMLGPPQIARRVEACHAPKQARQARFRARRRAGIAVAMVEYPADVLDLLKRRHMAPRAPGRRGDQRNRAPPERDAK